MTTKKRSWMYRWRYVLAGVLIGFLFSGLLVTLAFTLPVSAPVVGGLAAAALFVTAKLGFWGAIGCAIGTVLGFTLLGAASGKGVKSLVNKCKSLFGLNKKTSHPYSLLKDEPKTKTPPTTTASPTLTSTDARVKSSLDTTPGLSSADDTKTNTIAELFDRLDKADLSTGKSELNAIRTALLEESKSEEKAETEETAKAKEILAAVKARSKKVLDQIRAAVDAKTPMAEIEKIIGNHLKKFQFVFHPDKFNTELGKKISQELTNWQETVKDAVEMRKDINLTKTVMASSDKQTAKLKEELSKFDEIDKKQRQELKEIAEGLKEMKEARERSAAHAKRTAEMLRQREEAHMMEGNPYYRPLDPPTEQPSTSPRMGTGQ